MSDTNDTTGNPLPGLMQIPVKLVAQGLLTGVGGGLLAAGYISKVQDTQLITGGAAVLVWLAGVGWAIMHHKNAVAAAKAAPPQS